MNLRMQNFERETLMTFVNGKRVWLVHVFANVALTVAFLYWTRISEESGFQFALNVVSGLLIAFATLWLHSATFDYFHPPREFLFKRCLVRSLGHIPAFLAWSLIFGIGLWLIGQLWGYDEQIGGWIRHLLPGFMRRSVASRSAFSAMSWLMWFLYFFLWPILFLPVGAQVAVSGFRGFLSGDSLRPLRSLRFWVVYCVCFIIGAYVPYTLAWMTPKTPSSLKAQTWSMLVRLGIGYLLLVTAWLIVCAAIMRAIDGEEVADRELKLQPVPEPSGVSASEV